MSDLSRRDVLTPAAATDDRTPIVGPQTGAEGLRGSTPPRPEPAPGAHLGRYIILHRLGEGGMGVVFAAYDSQLHRKVAVKLLHREASGLEDGQARLLQEAQALAQLSHPNVVAVYDVGVVDGDVFLAMEFIDGQTLTSWLRERQRSWREILSVMLVAGRGLAAAHAVAIVHRDFKPDNVLIGRDGRVSVVDFGIARVTARADPPPLGADLSTIAPPAGSLLTPPGAEALTRAGTVLGTVPYLAPELLAGLPPSEATDQFAFAVSVFEALHGRRPFANAPLDSPERWRVTIPRGGRRVPEWLNRLLARALDPTPQKRHPSLHALLHALDADPAVTWRRRTLAAAGSCLVMAAIGVPYQTIRERRQLCTQEGERLRGVWDEESRGRMGRAFLASGGRTAAETWPRFDSILTSYASSWVAQRTQACRATRIEGGQSDETLSLRMECLDRRWAGFRALARLYERPSEALTLKAVDAASRLAPLEDCADVEALRAPVRPPDDPAIRERLQGLRERLAEAESLSSAGEYAQARGAVETIRAAISGLSYKPLEAEALALAGSLEKLQGDNERAQRTLRSAMLAAYAGKHPEVAARAGMNRAWAMLHLGRLDEVRLISEEAEASLDALGAGRADLQANLLSLNAVVAGTTGNVDEEIRLLTEALEQAERAYSPKDPRLHSALSNLGSSLGMRAGKPERALPYIRRSQELVEQAYGPNHPDLAYSHAIQGALLLAAHGPSADAERALRRGLELADRSLGGLHVLRVLARSSLGRLLVDRGDFHSAEPLLREAQQLVRERGEPPDDVMAVDAVLAEALRQTGRATEALSLQRRVVELAPKVLPPEAPELGENYLQLGLTLEETGHVAEALEQLRRALRHWEKHPGGDSPWLARGEYALGAWRVRRRRPREGLPLLHGAVARQDRVEEGALPRLPEMLVALGDAQLAIKDVVNARKTFERALPLVQSLGLAPELLGAARFGLARALVAGSEAGGRALELAAQAEVDFSRSQAKGRNASLEELRAWRRAR